jgi:hypothetical protein
MGMDVSIMQEEQQFKLGVLYPLSHDAFVVLHNLETITGGVKVQ